MLIENNSHVCLRCSMVIARFAWSHYRVTYIGPIIVDNHTNNASNSISLQFLAIHSMIPATESWGITLTRSLIQHYVQTGRQCSKHFTTIYWHITHSWQAFHACTHVLSNVLPVTTALASRRLRSHILITHWKGTRSNACKSKAKSTTTERCREHVRSQELSDGCGAADHDETSTLQAMSRRHAREHTKTHKSTREHTRTHKKEHTQIACSILPMYLLLIV